MTGVEARPRLSADFWKYFAGQTISSLGDSFTLFALPLLVFKLTGSAVNLALSTAANFIPYLLFGLVIGAYVDRVDRKRMMKMTALARAAVISTIPLLEVFGVLNVWWIYAAGFASSTLGIAFDAGEFAAIPSLVKADNLVTANARVMASNQGAQIAGPILAGALVAIIPITALFLFDATTFVASAVALSLVSRSFNVIGEEQPDPSTIWQDVREGLSYVLRHPVLRNISIMMALINFVGATTFTQLVLFAKERLDATDPQIGVLFSAGSAGVVLWSLAAGPLRRRWSFSTVALGALMADGALTVVFAFNRSFPMAVAVWGMVVGVGLMFNINTGALRQQIVPNRLLGRVITIASVLAWSAIPLGAVVGGIAIEATGDVALVYAAVGTVVFLIAFAFRFTALGHAEDFVPQEDKRPEETSALRA
ncbi:MAG: MFS transporter [Actinomycetota bacterium]